MGRQSRMQVTTPIERAVEAAIAAGVPRVEAERLAHPSPPPAPVVVPLRRSEDRIRSWFDSVGWELDEVALRSALSMLGAEDDQIDAYIVEAGERRLAGMVPEPFKGHRWIVIAKWDGPDGFQHYKDRDPIWIKNYRELLASEEYRELSFHQRGILHGLWLEYAASNRQISDSTVSLGRRLGHRVSTRDLISLNHAGFIHFSASKPLAQRYHDASPEKRREEPPISPVGETPTTTTRNRPQTFICPIPTCGIAKKTQQQLDDHLDVVHDQRPDTA